MILKSFLYAIIVATVFVAIEYIGVSLLMTDYGYYIVFGGLFMLLFVLLWKGIYENLKEKK